MDTFGVPREPAERRAWIVYRLRYHFRSLSAFAAEVGITKSAVTGALDRPSSHVEELIATHLNIPVASLFPDRFRPDGTRRHIVRPPKATRVGQRSHVENPGRG